LNTEQQYLLNEQIKTTLSKLERDIDRHRMQRQYHMRRSNWIVKVGVAFLLVMGVFNVLYLWDFYIRMQDIVNTITNLGSDVAVVSGHMTHLTGTMEKFDGHIGHMPSVSNAALSMSEQMPLMNQSVEQMLGSMHEVNGDMTGMRQDVVMINQRFGSITQGVNLMGHNVNAISGPMGMFNPFMP
jgi:methyl-accepting chemotaxis protein